MQTLNVGAGQSEKEYQANEQQRLADLRIDSQHDANYFFVAAGLATVSTGLLPVRITFLANIGVIDLLQVYGRSLGQFLPLAIYAAACAWILTLVVLAFIARSGHRSAFLVGIVLYGIDMLILTALFSILSFGVHAFLIFKWFQGQKTLKELHETSSPPFLS